MQGREFYDRIVGDPRYEWLGCLDSGAVDEVIVGCPGTGQFGARFAIVISEIAKHDWIEFEGILTGKRQPKLLEWMTRIVGYYSDVMQWNRSKVAELRDRQRGDYGVMEAA